eukprot:1155957-Pelagomonas_calceolata.AAC.3
MAACAFERRDARPWPQALGSKRVGVGNPQARSLFPASQGAGRELPFDLVPTPQMGTLGVKIGLSGNLNPFLRTSWSFLQVQVQGARCLQPTKLTASMY